MNLFTTILRYVDKKKRELYTGSYSYRIASSGLSNEARLAGKIPVK